VVKDFKYRLINKRKDNLNSGELPENVFGYYTNEIELGIQFYQQMAITNIQ
jgi:hypothetical protein